MFGIPTRARAVAAFAGVLSVALVVPMTVTTAPATAASARVPQPAAGSERIWHRTLHVGQTGPDVRAAQAWLGWRKKHNNFTPNMKKAVVRVQAASGLKRSGVIDARTMRYIKARHVAKLAAAKHGFKASKVLKMASKYKGRPYRHGGNGPSVFDCSGYTRYVFKKATGKTLARVASAQYAQSKHISRKNARPGDLIFFRSGGGIYHVGIYAGGNKLWHASRPGTRSGKAKIFSSNVVFGRI